MVVFPDLFLIAVSSNGIRMASEVPNIRVALVRVHAHSAGRRGWPAVGTPSNHASLEELLVAWFLYGQLGPLWRDSTMEERGRPRESFERMKD